MPFRLRKRSTLRIRIFGVEKSPIGIDLVSCIIKKIMSRGIGRPTLRSLTVFWTFGIMFFLGHRNKEGLSSYVSFSLRNHDSFYVGVLGDEKGPIGLKGRIYFVSARTYVFFILTSIRMSAYSKTDCSQALGQSGSV